jgi:hypothetical protein
MMEAITQLPAGYVERDSIDLKKDTRFLVAMQIWGTLALLVTGWLFWVLMARVRPFSLEAFGLQESLPGGGFQINFTGTIILGLLAALVLMVLIHEAVHGFFFWLFTSRRPLFGFKIYYAYAAAPPGTYLTRAAYSVVGAAPLVLLTAAGVLLLPVVPLWLLPTLYFFLVGNASGSIGDIMILIWLLRMPSSTLIEDLGDGMIAYAPASA